MRTARRLAWLCAKQELVLSVRSRWTQIFAVVFAGLALAVASSGYILTGGSGMQDFSRTAASLVQLVMLLVPLASIVFGVLSLSPEPGAAELLYAQPISRSVVLAGKLTGLFLALVASQAVGFGAAGLVVFARVGADGLTGYLAVAVGSALLTAVFLALAAVVTAGGAGHARRGRPLAVALVIWFASVVLFDVAALGVASLLPSGLASRVLMVSAIVNPVDAVRTGALLVANGTSAFGAASLALLRFTGGPLYAALWISLSLVVWMLASLASAGRRAERADL